jgi:hypothetical protein
LPCPREADRNGHQPRPRCLSIDRAPWANEDVLRLSIGFLDALQHRETNGRNGGCMSSKQFLDTERLRRLGGAARWLRSHY